MKEMLLETREKRPLLCSAVSLLKSPAGKWKLGNVPNAANNIVKDICRQRIKSAT